VVYYKHSHNEWCGKTGEENIDWEIKECEFGLGMFALRDISKYEKILNEKGILKFSQFLNVLDLEKINKDIEKLEESEKEALYNLHYIKNDISNDKSKLFSILNVNGLQFGENQSMICVNLSRVNNRCNYNSFHFYHKDTDSKVLIAAEDIKQGEQIFIDYSHEWDSIKERQEKFLQIYGFKCNCEVCNDKETDKIRIKIQELDEMVGILGMNHQYQKALNGSMEMIRLFENYKYPKTISVTRTYYDAYQMSIFLNSKKDQKKYLTLCYNTQKSFLGDEFQETKKYSDLLKKL
jgi:hypothetical protein